MTYPHRIASPSGISIELNANGSIRRMDHGDIMLNLFLGNEADGGLANIHLRRLGDVVETIPLLGPGSPASYETDERGLFACGKWGDLAFRLRLVLAESATAWFWHVELENTGDSTVTCDLIHTQDIALAHYGAIRLNEYYVSQYVDHSPLEHSKAGVRGGLEAEPVDGRSLPVDGDRLAGHAGWRMPPTRSSSTVSRRAPAASPSP